MSELLLGIASATSSDEIASVLEAQVPAGGWRAKRARYYYGLSAQFGASAGAEWTKGAGRGEQFEAYLPLGFDIGWPLHHRDIVVGGLVQVLDLGALTSTSFGNDMVQSRPNVSVTSTFAPGANLYIGLGHSPFVVAVGANYVPGLRRTMTGDLDAVRVSLALAIDLPLLLF
jgi:hypothetical protein